MKHYKRLLLMALTLTVLLTLVSAMSLAVFAENGSAEQGTSSVASLLQNGNTTYYDSLKDAVEASSDGDTVTVIANDYLLSSESGLVINKELSIVGTFADDLSDYLADGYTAEATTEDGVMAYAVSKTAVSGTEDAADAALQSTADQEASAADANVSTKGTFEAQAVKPVAKFGYAINLEESISIVYNVKDLTGDPADYEVIVTYPDGETTNTFTPDNQTLNSFIIANCAAKEMTDVYTVKVMYQDTQVNNTTEFSVRNYCDAVINNSSKYDAKLVALCQATLDYGTYAQKKFDYKTDDLANGGTDYFSENDIPALPEYSGTKEGSCENLKTIFFSLTTTCKTKFVLSFKFKDSNIDNYSVVVDDGAIEPEINKNGSRLDVIVEVAAKNLGQQMKFELKSGEETLVTYTASPVDYMAFAIKNNSETEINKRFYNYYYTAEEYFKAFA